MKYIISLLGLLSFSSYAMETEDTSLLPNTLQTIEAMLPTYTADNNRKSVELQDPSGCTLLGEKNRLPLIDRVSNALLCASLCTGGSSMIGAPLAALAYPYAAIAVPIAGILGGSIGFCAPYILCNKLD